jgi:hypothetical protein
MASPTFAQVWTQIKNVIKIYDDLKTNGTAYLTNLDTYQQSLIGDFASDSASLEESTRSAISSILDFGQTVLEGHFLELAKVIGSSQNTISQLLDPESGDLFQYFITNSQSLNSRNLTYGTITAGGGNVGNGTVYRLKTDRNSQNIEHVSLNAKKILCISDSNTGARVGEESFLLDHSVSNKDNLDLLALTPSSGFDASSPENGLIQNGSFQEIDGITGAGGLTSIPQWTIATGLITDFEYDSTNVYNSSDTELQNGTAYSLKMKANSKITQAISDANNSLDEKTPYMLLLHYNRQVFSGTGTLTIRMGTATASVVLGAQTGWNVLALAVDQNLWYRNFKENALNIEIELTGVTSGSVLIDWVIFDSMKFFDGSWFLIKPGSTNFQINDVFTFTDSLTATEAKIQYWLSRWFGLYLPHNNAGAETITDP